MIVLGIDPGMAAGKPIAIAAVEITPFSMTALWHCDRVVSASGPDGFNDWLDALQDAVRRWGPDLVAVEDALAPNLKSAAALQNVVMAVALTAKSAVVPMVKIHPSSVRPAIAFNHHTPTPEEVPATVNMLFGLDLSDDQHDTAFAYAVAVAGEAQWRTSRILQRA